MEAGRRNKPWIDIKALPIFGPPANGNKSNAKNPIVELVATQPFRNLEQPDLLQDRPNSWVLKRATTLLNSFRNN